MNNKTIKEKIVDKDGRVFSLYLVANNEVYYVDINEPDDNASTILYNQNGKLLSDNYFASASLFELSLKVLSKEIAADFISENCFKNLQAIAEL